MSADSQFSSTEEVDAITDYEPVDRLALTSLFLGVASVLALIHPLLWAIPVVALLLAFFALRRSAMQKRQSGRTLAVCGLGLALLFGSCGVSWSLSADLVLSRQSRKYCETWLETFREGKVYEAHQLTLQYDERLATNDRIDEMYAEATDNSDGDSGKMRPLEETGPDLPGAPGPQMDPEQKDPERMAMAFNSWRHAMPINKLVAFGPRIEYRYERNLGTAYTGNLYQAKHLYVIRYNQDGRSHTVPVEIVTDRNIVRGTAHWRIASARPYTENL